MFWSAHGIYLQVYTQTTLLVPHMYTNIYSHQHKITQLNLIRLVYTCNIWKFDTVIVWNLIHLSSNWIFNLQIAFQNYSYHKLTSSVSMVLQSIFNIMGSILHIYCPTSKKLYVLHWLVEMLQWNPIGVILIYAWKHLISNNLESSFMLLDTRCFQ